jgi:protein-tyrosine phosphatase
MNTTDTTPLRILMVCLGNICRSPTAEAVLRSQARTAGLEHLIDVDSAGTSDWHLGESPDPRAIQAAAERMYDLTPLRARQLTDRDFEDFDHILAMDRNNLEYLQEHCPLDYQHKLQLLLEYGATGWEEVPDPYNTGREDFELVLDLVETACQDLLTHLQQRHPLQQL